MCMCGDIKQQAIIRTVSHLCPLIASYLLCRPDLFLPLYAHLFYVSLSQGWRSRERSTIIFLVYLSEMHVNYSNSFLLLCSYNCHCHHLWEGCRHLTLTVVNYVVFLLRFSLIFFCSSIWTCAWYIQSHLNTVTPLYIIQQCSACYWTCWQVFTAPPPSPELRCRGLN